MVNHRQTVLLVEDDPFARRLVKSYLERMGLLVVEAADGRSALRRLTEMVPDLTCLDLVLPECSGYEVCEFIQRTPAIRDTPILVMSGRSLPEDRAHAIEAGASAYLIKPFTRAEFTKQVDMLLRSSAARRISSQFGVRQPPLRRATDVPAAKFGRYRRFRNYLSYGVGSLGRHKLLAAVAFALVVLGTVGSLKVLPADYFVETRIWAQRSQRVAALDDRRRANQAEADSPTHAAAETILRRDNLVALIKQTGAIANWKASTFPIPWLKARLIGLVRGRATDEDVNALAGILEQKMWAVAGESTVTVGLVWPDGPMAYWLVEAARQSFLEARYVSDISDIAETISILEGHAKSAGESIEASLKEIQRAREAAAGKRSPQLEPRPRSEPASSELARIEGMLAAKWRDIKEVQEFHQRYSTELQSQNSARLASLKKEEQQLLAEYVKRGGKMEDLATEGRPNVPLDTVRIKRETSRPDDDPSLDGAKARLNNALSKYERLLERIDGANLELDSARTTFQQRYTVILPAEMPKKRVTPTVPLMAGLIAALLAAIAAAVAADLRAGRIVALWQIEQQLSLPVLGHVPKLSSRGSTGSGTYGGSGTSGSGSKSGSGSSSSGSNGTGTGSSGSSDRSGTTDRSVAKEATGQATAPEAATLRRRFGSSAP